MEAVWSEVRHVDFSVGKSGQSGISEKWLDDDGEVFAIVVLGGGGQVVQRGDVRIAQFWRGEREEGWLGRKTNRR